MATCPDGHESVATDYCDECGLSMSTPAAGGQAGGGSAPGYGSAGEPCPNCLLPRQDGDTFCEGCGFPFDEEQSGETIDQPNLDLEAELRKAEQARLAVHQNAVLRPGLGDLAAQQDPAARPAPADPLDQTVQTDPVGLGSASAPTPAPSPAAPRWIVIAAADRAYYDAVVAEGEIDPNAYPFPPFCPERQFELKGDTVRIGRSGKRGTVDVDLTGPPTDPGVSHLHAVLQQRPDGGWTVVDLESMNGTVLNDDTAPIPPNQAFPVEAGHRIHVGVWTTLTLIQRS